MSRTPSSRRRGPAVLALLVLVAAAVGLLVWWRAGSGTDTAPAADAGPTAAAGTTTSAAATGTRAAGTRTAGTRTAGAGGGAGVTPVGAGGATSTAPSSSSAAATSATATGAALRQVDVSTTYAGWDDTAHQAVVAGFVTGVIEDGGTCTVTVTKGGRSVKAVTTASADAQNTACGDVTVPGLDSGSWSAVLSYRSATATGKAAAVTVVVP